MRKYLLLVVFLSANYFYGFTQIASQATPTVLRGTIILPEGVIRHGYVAIVNGRIASVSDEQPDLPNAVFLNTHGIILPGFVDVHNHVAFNVLPRWRPGRLFTNRNQWRTDPEVLRLITEPVNRLQTSHFCDMNSWSELRALVGGTTSIMTTQAQPCVHGLVRNLDVNSGFYGTTELDREHIFNVLDLPPASDPATRAAFVGLAHVAFITNPFYEALFIHLAEGTDAAAEEEFTFVKSQSLLNPKGAIIHGIPLSASDFKAMADKGTALVWSPRSNLELYGQTADMHAALDAGVEIALAPDWAITGSSNMLNELKVADLWNRERLGGRLSDRQLIDMATSIPARIAGVDDHVGAISPGLRADLLVINGDHNQPYRAAIDATAADVALVFIDGVPLYGDRIFMEHFWKRSELEEITLPDAKKTLATPAANVLVAGIETRLRAALQAEGVSLAPLTEADDFTLTPLPMAGISSSPNNTQNTNRSNDITQPVKLTVTALPNPSSNHFTLNIQSSSSETLRLKVLDALGRIVESKEGIIANTTFHIGSKLRRGTYFVEVVQGKERQMFKLIRR